MKAVNTLILSILALFVITSCHSQGGDTKNDATVLCKKESFSSVSDSYSVMPLWKSDDKIAAVMDGHTEQLSLSVGVKGYSASFTGSLSGKSEIYYWVFPYSENIKLNGKKLSMLFPQTQYASTHICSPAFAFQTKDGEAIQFKNLCSALSFKLKGSGIITRAILSSLDSSESLWGTFAFDVPSNLSWPKAEYVSGGGPSLVLDCGSGINLTAKGTRLEFAVPAGCLKRGFKVEFIFLDGKSRTLTLTEASNANASKLHTCAPYYEMDPIVVNLENYIVKQYLSTVHYPDNDYSYTLVESYANAKTEYRKDRPSSVFLQWVGVSGASSQKLQLSENSDFSSICKEISLSSAASACDIWNLVPGKEFFYRVLADFDAKKDSLVCCSNFYTEGNRRYMYFDNINNVRDLGGLKTADGKKRIRYGKLFRGSEMQGKKGLILSDKGRTQMKEERIYTDIDFRRDNEKLGYVGSPIGTDVVYLQFPNADKHYTNVCKTNSYVSSVRWTIKRFMAEPDKAIYFHCAVGADRTGMHAFFIEGICGVSEEDLAKDYELTSFSTPPGMRRRTNTPYDYAGFIKVIKTLSGNTLQEKCYTYLTGGVVTGGDRIGKTPVDSVAWLRDFLLEDVK